MTSSTTLHLLCDFKWTLKQSNHTKKRKCRVVSSALFDFLLFPFYRAAFLWVAALTCFAERHPSPVFKVLSPLTFAFGSASFHSAAAAQASQ